jgi:bifunctional oligoribonuclease and PAP phosphatase NrnA
VLGARPVTAVSESEWALAVKAIDGARQVGLLCHVRPDADALGSMLALGTALTASRPGTEVVASFGDEPFEVPGTLRFLPGQELLVEPAQFPARSELVICLDASGLARLGRLAKAAEAAGERIVIDHHATNTGFGTVNLVDPAAPASAVLAAELISRLGVDLTADIALGLYAGLSADTGSFRFAATPQIHGLAARLVATGVDASAVARQMFDRAPFGYLRLLSVALGRAVLEPAAAHGLGLVWTTVTRADRAAAGVPFDAAEDVIGEVRRVDEAEVALVLKEDDRGDWEVSARSKTLVDVAVMCAALGGGGHARAAGFSVPGREGVAVPADQVVAAVREQLDRA